MQTVGDQHRPHLRCLRLLSGGIAEVEAELQQGACGELRRAKRQLEQFARAPYSFFARTSLPFTRPATSQSLLPKLSARPGRRFSMASKSSGDG